MKEDEFFSKTEDSEVKNKLEQTSIKMEPDEAIVAASIEHFLSGGTGIKVEPIDEEYVNSGESESLDQATNDLDPADRDLNPGVKEGHVIVNNETGENDAEFFDTIKSEDGQTLCTISVNLNTMEPSTQEHYPETSPVNESGLMPVKIEEGSPGAEYSLLAIEHTPLSISQSLSHHSEYSFQIKSEDSETMLTVEMINNTSDENQAHLDSKIRHDPPLWQAAFQKPCPTNCLGCRIHVPRPFIVPGSKPKQSEKKPIRELSKEYVESWRKQLAKEIQYLSLKQYRNKKKKKLQNEKTTRFKKKLEGHHHPSAFRVVLRDIFKHGQKPDTSIPLRMPNYKNHLKCLWCRFSTRRVRQLYNHLWSIHRHDSIASSAIHSCPRCLLLFTDRLEFNRHLWQTHHLPEEEIAGSLTCEYLVEGAPCKERFVENSLLLRHKAEAHGIFESDFTYCRQCPAVLDNSKSKWHMEAHFKVFICPQCTYAKVGPSPLELLQHFTQHLPIGDIGDKIRRCRFCGSIFFTKSSYRSHLQGDNCPAKVRLFMAPRCQMSYFQNFILQIIAMI